MSTRRSTPPSTERAGADGLSSHGSATVDGFGVAHHVVIDLPRLSGVFHGRYERKMLGVATSKDATSSCWPYYSNKKLDESLDSSSLDESLDSSSLQSSICSDASTKRMKDVASRRIASPPQRDGATFWRVFGMPSLKLQI